MSQPRGGLSSVGRCHSVTFPQVRAFSECRAVLWRTEQVSDFSCPVLCPPGSTLSPYGYRKGMDLSG